MQTSAGAEPLQRTPAQLAESIAELTGQLKDLKRRKRSFLSDINEQIREVEEILEGEQEQWKQLKEKGL